MRPNGTSHRPTAIDLFSGAGGATQGLRDAGFHVVAAVESDLAAAATYRANHPRTRLHVGDIRHLDPQEVLRSARLKQGDLTLLQACPPCQTWSSLGKRDAKDYRNDLLLDCVRFIDALRPRAFVIENVIGLRRDPRFAKFVRLCRRMGYGTRTYTVSAEQFGVPQRRKRLLLLGIAGRDGRGLPKAILPAGRIRLVSVGAALRNLPADPLNQPRDMPESVRRRIAAIPEGGNRFDLPRELTLRCHANLTGRSATGSYGRMDREKPAPTLTTRCTTPACGPFIHPTEDRGITLREAAALQTFPRHYRFQGNYGDIERQIGNAIPVKLAKAVSRLALSLISVVG